MLLRKTGDDRENNEVASQLKQMAGYTILPVRLKVRFFDDEAELVVYNTLSLFLLLQKLADVTSMPSNAFKVKAIE